MTGTGKGLLELRLGSEEETARLGAALARAVAPFAARAPFVVHLRGDLGAGKTTLARAWLAALGHRGPVRSPTYTLVEGYEGEGWRAWHLDLYRLVDPGELEMLGIRDLLAVPGLLLVEWPERGGESVPPADLVLALSHDGSPGRRRARLEAQTARGTEALGRLDPASSRRGRGGEAGRDGSRSC